MSVTINGSSGLTTNDGSVFTNASGNVGIGTASPSRKLEVYSTSASFGKITAATTSQSVLEINNNSGANNFYIGIDTSTGGAFNAGSYGRVLYSDGAFPIVFSTNSTERMRIDTSGNLLVGTISQFGSGKQCILFDGTSFNGISLQTSRSATGSNFLAFYNSSVSQIGNINQNGASTVQYATSSDYRLKEDVQPMQGALATVAQLKPVTYKWKVDGSAGQGFIAHELQAVVPDCVSGQKDAVDTDGNPEYQGIDTSFLVATLTAAIQEQQALIQSLTDRITTLEAK